MGNYNIQYNNLKRRLNILKLLNDSEDTSKIIDRLLKELDERYSDGRLLVNVESEINLIER